MTALSPSRPYASSPAADNSLLGDSYPAAGLVCLFGFFLHIILSDPLLNAIGLLHTGEGGKFYERLHPGTIFIVISFFVLLASRGSTIRQFCKIAVEQTIPTMLLVLTFLLIFYMVLRSGFSVSFMIETHLTVPICAIVLSYTPISYCRRAMYGFLLLAVTNSAVGIAEAIGRFRIFTFDPNWVVMKEPFFRATAFLGHPLNNAMFTSVALFVALALRLPTPVKWLCTGLFLTSLVAFGGRIGLLYSVVGSLLYGFIAVLTLFRRGHLGIAQRLLLLSTTLVVPFIVLGGLYLLVNSSMGERLAGHAKWDESADTRRLAWYALDYMTDVERIFGASPERIVDIAYRIGLALPISDIENPWILMYMNLGAIMFPFWAVGLAAFLWKLMRDRPLALKMAVLGYFVVASTSNSFGRKDSIYLIMVSAVTCAARMLLPLPTPARPAIAAPPP